MPAHPLSMSAQRWPSPACRDLKGDNPVGRNEFAVAGQVHGHVRFNLSNDDAPVKAFVWDAGFEKNASQPAVFASLG